MEEHLSLTGSLVGSFSLEQTPRLSSHSYCLLRALQLRVPHLAPPPLLAVPAVLLRQGTYWAGGTPPGEDRADRKEEGVKTGELKRGASPRSLFV